MRSIALAQPGQTARPRATDEVHALSQAFDGLHGHLEALNQGATPEDEARRGRLASAALVQCDKVRRLSRQLFELATLQSTDPVHRERFRLDELVADTVQKFELTQVPSPVTLAGQAPGPVALDGDLHLIERALTSLIDNAVRHAPGAAPVRISLRCDGLQATVMVEDQGPGLPAELARRLDAGQPVRDPPLRRPGPGHRAAHRRTSRGQPAHLAWPGRHLPGPGAAGRQRAVALPLRFTVSPAAGAGSARHR